MATLSRVCPSEAVERVAEADGSGGLALAGGGRVECGDQNQLAGFLSFWLWQNSPEILALSHP